MGTCQKSWFSTAKASFLVSLSGNSLSQLGLKLKKSASPEVSWYMFLDKAHVRGENFLQMANLAGFHSDVWSLYKIDKMVFSPTESLGFQMKL